MKKILMSALRISLMITFFTCGVLMSCSMLVPREQDSDLQPYVKDFAEEIGVEVKELDSYSLTFLTLSDEKVEGEETSSIIGTCQPATGVINIDPKYFYTSRTPELKKRALIYHELMHCHCLSKHDKSMMADGCPTTIMTEFSPRYQCLKKHWDTYMDDMAERCY